MTAIDTCRVCELVDGDTSPKAVTFCESCGAWICANCMWNPIRRGIAALRGLKWGGLRA